MLFSFSARTFYDVWSRKLSTQIFFSHTYGFGSLGVACWPLVPKFVGSNPAEAVRFLGGKILSTPSFGGEVKPSFPCRRFAACKRSLNLRGSWNLGKITTGHLSRPQFHLSLLGSLASLAAKVGTSKGGGKQWKTTPKNLPRMQCARAIPVTWLGSGSCQARPSRLNSNEWKNCFGFICLCLQTFSRSQIAPSSRIYKAESFWTRKGSPKRT